MEGYLSIGSVLKMLIRFLGKADICLSFSDAGVIRTHSASEVFVTFLYRILCGIE